MMEAFVQQQNRNSSFGKRFDYVTLAPAAAAPCYPFLLRAFHAIVGSQAATPSPLAIVGAILVLAVAFVVPFLGLALACCPTATIGARRLAYARRGRADALCLPWRRPGTGSQSHLRRNRLVRDLARDRDLFAVRPKSRRCPSARGRALAGCPWADGSDPLPLRVVPSHQSSVRPGRPRCPRNRHEDRTRGLSLWHRRTAVGGGHALPDRHWPLSRMALERRRSGLPPDISGRLGRLSLAVHPRAHELGLHLRPLLSRHTDRLEFRDRRPNRAHP